MRYRVSKGVVLLLGVAAPLTAQQSAGDSAWAAGDFHSARIAYERVLQADLQSVRANYRLGILASWDGQLDSALVLIRRARAVEPGDPDLRLTEALVLAWAGRYHESLLRYDSVIAEYPDRADAALARGQTLTWANRLSAADSAYLAILARDPDNLDAATGRAQIAAWRGDLKTAVVGYRAVLARKPDHADALAGLGQVYLWQGRVTLAREQSHRALEADSGSRSARDLQAAIRASTRPQPETTLGWSNDSDHNTSWWQTLAASLMVADGLRAFGSVGAYEASDRFLNGSRLSAEAGVRYAFSNLQVTGALGVRSLSPDSGASRGEGTWRLSASYRPGPSIVIGASYARYPFDETALLIQRHVDINAVEGGVDVTIRPGLTATAGGGQAWFSDANTRTSGVVAATQTIRRDFFAGVFARALWYDFEGTGYFSPDRFTVFEVRGGWTRVFAPWSARVSGGIGVQQVGGGAQSQGVGHLEGRLGRRWKATNSVEIFGGISNSAESSTTGAFRYRTAGIIVRIGL